MAPTSQPDQYISSKPPPTKTIKRVFLLTEIHIGKDKPGRKIDREGPVLEAIYTSCCALEKRILFLSSLIRSNTKKRIMEQRSLSAFNYWIYKINIKGFMQARIYNGDTRFIIILHAIMEKALQVQLYIVNVYLIVHFTSPAETTNSIPQSFSTSSINRHLLR